MQTAAAPRSTLLLRSTAVFHPRQSAVAGKNLRVTDAVMDSERVIQQVPRAAQLAELIEAAREHKEDVAQLAAITQQVAIASKFTDFYVLMRDFGAEWDRFAALYPESAADGWIGLLVNRARVLVAEVDGIADENRN